MKGFGARLREARESRKLSQQELADLAGIHIGQISRYEREVMFPTAEKIFLLARALEISADALIFGERRPTPEPVIRHPKLLERFQKADVEIEDRKDLETLVTLVDAFLSRKQLKRMVASA